MTPSISRTSKWIWIFLSMAIFLAVELFLGGFVGHLVAGRFIGHVFYIKIEMILMLASYLFGGLIVGMISPDIRILEPAVGAFLAVLLTALYGFFTPSHVYGFALNRLLIGGGIAFILALVGADCGERIAARFGNRASQRYLKK